MIKTSSKQCAKDWNKTKIINVVDVIMQFTEHHYNLMNEREEAILEKSDELEKFRIQKTRS